MTDKVQKIREKVEMVINRRLNLLNGDYFDLNEEVYGFTNEIVDIIDSLQEEPVSDDLEKEIEESWKHLDLSFIESGYEMFKVRNIVSDIVHHFVYWKKQQMIKDAVEYKVIDLHENEDGESIPSIIVDLPKSFDFGDKVKVIIIKED